jgi:transposase
MSKKKRPGVEKLSSLELWTRQLGLEGFEVVHERHDRPDDPVRLTLVSTARVALCPHCQRPSESEHTRRDSNPIRDLSHGPLAVELIIHQRQFHCPHCDRYFTPVCPYVAPGTHATARFLDQAAKLIRFSDIANVAAFLGVPEKTLEGWYYDYVQRKTQQPPTTKPIESVGIDELSLKKAPAVRSGHHRPYEQVRSGCSGGA